MANPDPSRASRFKPGQSGNPAGKPKGMLTADQVSASIGRLAALTVDELKSKKTDPKTPAIEAIMASILVEAFEKGDFARLESLLSRGVGKVRDVAEVHTHNHDAELDSVPKTDILTLLRDMRGPKTGT